MTTTNFICENFEVFTAIAESIDNETTNSELVKVELVNTLSVEYINKYPQHPKMMIINTVIRAANEHNSEVYQRNVKCVVNDVTSFSLNRTIQMLVDHFLDRKTPVEYDYSTHCYSRPAIGFKINLRSQWQGDDDLGPEIVQTIYMVFTGNTSVFYCSPYDDNGNKEYWHIEDVPSECWINTSNHDSCWRSDGFSFLFNLRMQMCKLANSKVPSARINSEAAFGFSCNWPIENFTAIFKSNVNDYGYVLIKLIPQKVEK